jgi:hypothetical protein
MVNSNRFSQWLWAASVVLPLAGCGGGSGVSGAYVPTGESLWKRFEFQGKDKVVTTNFMDQTVGGDYVVMEDGRIKLMINGDVLTLKKGSDGCLVVAPANAQEEAEAKARGMDLSELGHFCKE